MNHPAIEKSSRQPAFGYCCISLGLHQSAFRSTTLSSCSKKRKESLPKLKKIWQHNLEELARVLDYNMAAGILLYRISSALFPLADHPRYIDVWSRFSAGVDKSPCVQKVRQFLAAGGRLTMHPGQFVSLGSPSKSTRKNSIANLELHAQIMDLLGLPQSHFAAINIHLSGGLAKEKNLKHFEWSLSRLSPSVRRRLVFENEDKAFWVWQNIVRCFPGYPVTLDSHHHRINNLGDSLKEAAQATGETWGHVLPVRHLSEGMTGPLDRAHHDWVEHCPPAFLHARRPATDIEVEAKKKDLAVLYLKAKYKC